MTRDSYMKTWARMHKLAFGSEDILPITRPTLTATASRFKAGKYLYAALYAGRIKQHVASGGEWTRSWASPAIQSHPLEFAQQRRCRSMSMRASTAACCHHASILWGVLLYVTGSRVEPVAPKSCGIRLRYHRIHIAAAGVQK